MIRSIHLQVSRGGSGTGLSVGGQVVEGTSCSFSDLTTAKLGDWSRLRAAGHNGVESYIMLAEGD
jgi:hypothetical protein